jgi:hypothetical protein
MPRARALSRTRSSSDTTTTETRRDRAPFPGAGPPSGEPPERAIQGAVGVRDDPGSAELGDDAAPVGDPHGLPGLHLSQVLAQASLQLPDADGLHERNAGA